MHSWHIWLYAGSLEFNYMYFDFETLKVGSWGFEGTIILIILFSKLLESNFYKEISKFQQKV